MSEKVTIICAAYNHEKYISQALESFINQKTDFEYKVIVHDDASTDNTTNIIKEYEKKYPQIIWPIFQKENQYSKNVKISYDIVLPNVRSKYICFCEGDDFLIDENKLQKQFDFMESHPECSMCCHSFLRVNEKGEALAKINGEEGYYCLEDILNKKAPIFHTSSMFVRTEDYRNIPKSFLSCSVGDVVTRWYMATLGKIYYFSKPMSAYREFSQNSWSKRMFKDKEYVLVHLSSMIKFFNDFNDYTDYRYCKLIEKSIDNTSFNDYYIAGMFSEARHTNTFKEKGIKTKLLINLGCIFPKLMNKFRKLIHGERY